SEPPNADGSVRTEIAKAPARAYRRARAMSASPPPGPIGAKRPAAGLAGLISAMTSKRGGRLSRGGGGRRRARRTSARSPRRARASATRARLPAAIRERKSDIVAPRDEARNERGRPSVFDRRGRARDGVGRALLPSRNLDRERGAEDEGVA